MMGGNLEINESAMHKNGQTKFYQELLIHTSTILLVNYHLVISIYNDEFNLFFYVLFKT
jgi:hypothetical protein